MTSISRAAGRHFGPESAEGFSVTTNGPIMWASRTNRVAAGNKFNQWQLIPGAVTTLFADEFLTSNISSSGNAVGVPGFQILMVDNNTGSITDNNNGVWTITGASPNNGGVVQLNGSNAGFTANVIELAFDTTQHVMWLVNTQQQWFSWNGSTWTSGPDPTGGRKGWLNHYAFGGNEFTLSANNEAEYYGAGDRTPGFNPFSIANSLLTITADTVAHTVANPLGLPYNSGAMVTANEVNATPVAGLFNFQYGHVAARMMMPSGRGLWPTFWLMPLDGTSAEIDIVEAVGQNTTQVFCTIHDPVSGANQTPVTVTDYSMNFHEYAVDWRSDFITWLIDGVTVKQVATPAAFNKPFYILFDLAVGGTGSFPGPPDGTTVFPAHMQIDYVRVTA